MSGQEGSGQRIYAAMAEIMHEVGWVGKNKKNPTQGYAYRSVDDVIAALQGIMADKGVVCIPRVVERERESWTNAKNTVMTSTRLLVDHTFYAADGSHVVCTTLGEALDTSDKSANKAMTAALKYALVECFLIPTFEPDRDTEEHSREPTKPLEERPTQRVFTSKAEERRYVAQTAPHPTVEAAKKTFPGAEETDPWFMGRFKHACERIWPGLTESDYQERVDGALGIMGCTRKQLPVKGDVWTLFNSGGPHDREDAITRAEDMLRDRDDVPDFKGGK